MTEGLHDYVLRELERTKYRWPRVAAGSGVRYKTIGMIARRELKDPKVSHIEKLARFFREQGASIP